MTFDSDLQLEGLNQICSRDFKTYLLKNLTFAAWQLPFLERPSVFGRRADGTIDVEQGANPVQCNNENNGYWAELQVGRATERGDFLAGYTLMRIEKDAVLMPFNWSDITQQSDIRAQRFVFANTADPRVTLSLTAIITERSNGLLGIFGLTLPGSLNSPTTRLQIDTTFRF